MNLLWYKKVGSVKHSSQRQAHIEEVQRLKKEISGLKKENERLTKVNKDTETILSQSCIIG